MVLGAADSTTSRRHGRPRAVERRSVLWLASTSAPARAAMLQFRCRLTFLSRPGGALADEPRTEPSSIHERRGKWETDCPLSGTQKSLKRNSCAWFGAHKEDNYYKTAGVPCSVMCCHFSKRGASLFINFPCHFTADHCPDWKVIKFVHTLGWAGTIDDFVNSVRTAFRQQIDFEVETK